MKNLKQKKRKDRRNVEKPMDNPVIREYLPQDYGSLSKSVEFCDLDSGSKF